MQARYVPKFDLDAAAEPGSSLWRATKPEAVPLIATPIGLQPNTTIQVSWMPPKKIGATTGVEAAAIHDGETIAFRLAWEDEQENGEIGDITGFPDACGVLFPAVTGAIVSTMGAPGLGVNAWYWRADEDGRGRQVVAEGLGTTRTVDVELVRGRGVWEAGRWQVVISRSMRIQTSELVAQLEPGQTTGFAVAVWEGSNSERAGIKAYSGEWRELQLEALPMARR
jgi:DMSO reductase family type II enzyme heme b subunit